MTVSIRAEAVQIRKGFAVTSCIPAGTGRRAVGALRVTVPVVACRRRCHLAIVGHSYRIRHRCRQSPEK